MIVIVKVIGVPVQVTPLLVKLATTLKVDVSGAPPAFVAVNVGTLPVPAVVPSPIASLVRLHEKVAPATLLENTIDGTDDPEQ